jgi:hypothetical protein
MSRLHDDQDIVIQTDGGAALNVGSSIPIPVGFLDAAREFGRRQDRDGFRRWLSRCNSDARNWQRLQLEYDRAAAGEEMPAWKKCWRDGIAPQLDQDALKALRRALLNDDRRLIQGATTSPPPLHCVSDWQVEAADAISFALWQGNGYATVGQLEEQFALVCMKASEALGDPTGCRWFLNWWDETDRKTARQALLVELDLHLFARMPEQPAQASTPLAKLLAASIRHEQAKGGAA